MKIKSNKLQVKYIISLLLVLITFHSEAQILEDLTCPMPIETRYSKLSMEIFFTDVNYKNIRITSGTENISLSEVHPVDNEDECANLQKEIKNLL